MANRTPTLETQRLLLRPVTLGDAPDIQRLFGTFEVIRYIGPVSWPYPDDGALQFYRDNHLPKIEAGETLGWGITNKLDASFMGAIDLRTTGKDTVGFWIGLPFRRQGYMSESVTAVYDYAFAELKMKRIIIHNAAENIASHTIQVRSGAALTGIAPSKYANAMLPQESWCLKPQAWRASPMKQVANNPSYILR